MRFQALIGALCKYSPALFSKLNKIASVIDTLAYKVRSNSVCKREGGQGENAGVSKYLKVRLP